MTESSPLREINERTVKRCWLHVGMHKTGTTSLQVNLAKMKKTVGWRYIKVGGRANMGKALCAMFASNPQNHSAFDKLGIPLEEIIVEGEKLKKKLRKAILKTKQETIIISAEALSVAIDKKGIVALKEFLEPLCEEIRVIGYVRPPLGFKISIFQEAVKHGKSVFDIADRKVHYRKRFKKFDEVFGRENVILRKFDPANFSHHCIVADFCEQIGIEGPARSDIERTNESLTREACGLLFAYRKFGPGYGIGEDVIKENSRIIAPLFGISGSKLKVSKALLKSALGAERRDIGWMEKRIGSLLREKITDDGTEVSVEEDLLMIKRSTCEEYAANFANIHGDPIPVNKIPSTDPVDPRDVAIFVEYCRTRCRKMIMADRARESSWIFKYSRLVERWCNRLKAISGLGVFAAAKGKNPRSKKTSKNASLNRQRSYRIPPSK